MQNEEQENLFGEIDLSDLLSGDAVIEPKEPTQPKSTAKDDDEGKGKEEQNNNLIDLKVLDAIGSEEDIQDKGEGTDNSTIDNSSSSTPPITILAQALREEGILSTLDEEKLKEIKDAKSLVGAIKDYIAENELADLDEDSKAFIELARAGRAPEAIKQAVAAKQAVEKIDEKQLEGEEAATLRQQIIYTELKEKGIDDERAKKMVKTFVELGEDLSEAKNSLKTLKENRANELRTAAENARKEKELEEVNTQKELSNLKDTIYKTDEVFKGHKINQTTKDKIFESMTKVVGKDKAGKPINAITEARSKNPVDFDTKLHYLFQITKGFTDLSAITKKEKSSALKDLENSLEPSSLNQGNNGKINTTSTNEMLKQLPF